MTHRILSAIFGVAALLLSCAGSVQGQVPGGGSPMVPVGFPGIINGPLSLIGTGVSPVSCPYSQAYICYQTPTGLTFAMAWFDGAGNLTRTFDQTTGRMDLRANSAAGSVQGAAMVVNFTNSSPANNDVLGHYAWRGSDTVNGAASQDTYAYINATATNVTGTGSNLNSKISLGVMVNQTAGAGNAQPNTFLTWDGANVTAGVAAFFGTSAGTATFGGGGVAALAATSTGLSTSLPTQVKQELVANKTSNYTVTTTDGGTIFTTISAAGEVDFTLPATPGGSGLRYTFMVSANQLVKVIANTGQTIRCGGSSSSSAGNISTSTSGHSVEVVWLNSATAWQVRSVTGSGGSTGCGGWTAA